MSSSLAKALAKYNRPAPESLDPETADDFGDVHARPKSAKKKAASLRANGHDEGHEELAPPSVKKPEGRKLRRSDLLTDPKYSGRKVDRATLLAAASQEEEEEEEEEDDDDDEDEDNDEEEDEMSDVSDGDLDAKLEELLAARRSRAVTDMEEEEEDDDEDEEEEEEEEEEEDDDDDVEVASKRMLLRKPRVSRQDPDHVKNQYSLWCELVGLRIRLQGLMQASFRFPLPDAALEKVASETTTNRSKVNEAQELMTACSDKLGGILEKLVQIRETTAPAQARFLAASGDASEDEGEDSAGQGTPSRKRKRSPSWSEIEAGNVRAQRFAEKTFDVWHQRTTQSQGSSRKALKAVNRTISQQVDEIMSGGNAFISRAQVRPPGVVPIGAAQGSESDDDDKADETEAETEGSDMEVYNDSSFYQQLLLAFVSSSNAVSATRVADVDDEEVQDRLRRKLEREQKKNPKKREVDTNASKGRKLRYTVHEKLVNFAAPRPVEEPSVDTVQLFASLFRR